MNAKKTHINNPGENKPMSDLISKEEFQEITGAKMPSKICEKLREEGIRFIRRYDGWPSLTWTAYNRQLCNANIPNTNNPSNDGFNLESA